MVDEHTNKKSNYTMSFSKNMFFVLLIRSISRGKNCASPSVEILPEIYFAMW